MPESDARMFWSETEPHRDVWPVVDNSATERALESRCSIRKVTCFLLKLVLVRDRAGERSDPSGPSCNPVTAGRRCREMNGSG